jgi:gas vesicle protein
MHTREVLTGVGLGAAAAFLLDPSRGNARRARIRDKATWASRKTRDGIDATARDLGNRARGIAAVTRSRFQPEAVEDEVLVERVRSRLGRASSHPRAIEVTAANGDVTLSGPVLAHELDHVVAAVATVRGVCCVHSELEPRASGENIPARQGQASVAGPNLDLLQRNWAPATKALVAAGVLATGMGIAAYARGASAPRDYSH